MSTSAKLTSRISGIFWQFYAILESHPFLATALTLAFTLKVLILLALLSHLHSHSQHAVSPLLNQCPCPSP